VGQPNNSLNRSANSVDFIDNLNLLALNARPVNLGVRLFLYEGVRMSKVTLVCFSVVVLLLSCGASFACPASDDCPATEITIDSFGIRGRVMLVERGRERGAGRVKVYTYYFLRGEWRPMGTIIGGGGFRWKSDWIGRYKLVVRYEGFKATTLIVNVMGLKDMWNVLSVPLKADGCARVQLIRVER
jgi:hypothetical protein